ncbi:MAG: serine hydrolase [Streptosporangiales bacterium]|nr:serine hydrolase [Streptosporangiales bacterium]
MRGHVVVLVALGGLLCASVPARVVDAAESEAGPPTATAADVRFTPHQTLRYGSARDAGLIPEHIAAIAPDVSGFLSSSPPMYAGAVVLAAHRGTIVTHQARGHALRYSSYDEATGEAAELPRERWVPMRRDTVFDVASVSKLFTSIAAVQQAERGRLDLDAAVADYIPRFAQNGKGDITVRQLLTHTSGLPEWLPLYSDYPTPEARIAAVYAVEPAAPAGDRYLYSDLNMITLGKLVEKVTGHRLDDAVARGITGPLGMTDTGYRPPDSERHRIAATEYQPWTGRGMVRGEVHDENAWSLEGVAGHAGVFSTARDLAVLAQTVLNGGRYGDARILDERSVRLLLTDFNEEFPGDNHGLGFELAQRWYMDALASPVTAGHTGYTGTSLVLDPLSHSFAVLLTNRVHPTREWGSNNPARRAVARDLARALPVRPRDGRTAWFSGMVDDRTVTLTLPLPDRSSGGRATFDLWYDTEAESDVGTVQARVDGEWQPVPLSLRTGRYRWRTDGTFSGFQGRRWLRAQAGLPAGVTALRWRYTTDALYQGRGVYVDGVRVFDAHGGPIDADGFRSDGWTRSGD